MRSLSRSLPPSIAAGGGAGGSRGSGGDGGGRSTTPQENQGSTEREVHAQRILDFHQSQISDHMQKTCDGPGNEKPFRQHLTNGIDTVPVHLRWREQPRGASTPRNIRSEGTKTSEGYLIDDSQHARRRGPLTVGGTPVAPKIRLRRPAGLPGPETGRNRPPVALVGGSSSSSSRPPKASPRQLPPLAYTGIDRSLAGGKLPAAWFNDQAKLHETSHSSTDASVGGPAGAVRAKTSSPLDQGRPVGTPPLSARSPRPRGGPVPGFGASSPDSSVLSNTSFLGKKNSAGTTQSDQDPHDRDAATIPRSGQYHSSSQRASENNSAVPQQPLSSPRLSENSSAVPSPLGLGAAAASPSSTLEIGAAFCSEGGGSGSVYGAVANEAAVTEGTEEERAQEAELANARAERHREAEESARAMGLQAVEVLEPPAKAKGLYLVPGLHGGHREWRPCEVLAYGPAEQQYLIQWSFGNALRKRVSALQLILEGETLADGERRIREAELRRDAVESMMLEQMVVEELSNWEAVVQDETVKSNGASLNRIMELAQLKRYEASDEVVRGLVMEASQSYSHSQAKWVLLWRRPDLEEYLGIKPVTHARSSSPAFDRISESQFEDSYWDLYASEEAPTLQEDSCMPHNGAFASSPLLDEDNKSAMMSTQQPFGAKVNKPRGPGGVRGNLAPNRKFRNLPSRSIMQKAKLLSKISLLGSEDQCSRIMKVLEMCGKILSGGEGVELFRPTARREPYSLREIRRSLEDRFARSRSQYCVSWPEKLTAFFTESSGATSKLWNTRTSNIVARSMEASLHNLCMTNLHQLVELADHYAKLTKEILEDRLTLTYMPPPVYRRTEVTSYARHPMFRIQVLVGRDGSDFKPTVELAVEAFFASASTKDLEVFVSRKRFADTTRQVRKRHQVEAGAKIDMRPDGGATGGAPTANALAIQKSIATVAASMALTYASEETESFVEQDSDYEPEQTPLTEQPSEVNKGGGGGGDGEPVLFEDVKADICVQLTAQPSSFQAILGSHFRKVVELTDNFHTIDGFLQHDEDFKETFLSSLSSVHGEAVKDLEAKFNQGISSCFFDASNVVQEVARYSALLQRFGGMEAQLKQMLHMPEEKPPPAEQSQDGEHSQDGEQQSQSKVAADGSDENNSEGADEATAAGAEEEGKAEENDASSKQGEVEARFVTGVATSIEEVKQHLDCIDGWAKELNETKDLPERHLGLFVVDVSPLRKALLAMCACCRLRLLGCVQRWLQEKCSQLMAALRVKASQIIMSPKYTDELQSTLQAVNGLEDFLNEKQPILRSIRNMFSLLEDCCHHVPQALQKRWYECIHTVPTLRDKAEKWKNLFRKELRGRFIITIAETGRNTENDADEYRQTLEEYACKVSLNQAQFYYDKFVWLQGKITALQERVKKQHEHEAMMGMPLSEFPSLFATVEQISPLLELWYLAHEWIEWKEEILFGEFARIDPNVVKQRLQSCTETMRRLEDVFSSQPRPRQVLHSLSLELTELRVLLPVIVSLRNPGLRERHWTLIGEAIDQNIQASQMKDINLSVMNERYPFVAHLSKIQAISETASKEMLIEDDLKKMQDDWLRMPFNVKPIEEADKTTEVMDDGHGEDHIVLMADFRHKEVWELITEQMAKVRLLGKSQHAAVHAKALVHHDAKLKAVGDLCDLLHESHHGYLCAREHLMSEGLVRELMQKDTERNKEWRSFAEVEKQWQNILSTLRTQPSWLALLEVPKMVSTCREATAVMERIQRSIHDVLDLRRAQVPHFYRLSDAALLRVIKHGHDPKEPAIRDCLPGVLALDVTTNILLVDGGKLVHGMVGDVGEYLALADEVAVEEGMQIEEWLPTLFVEVERSLRSFVVGLIISDFSITDSRLMDERFPLQARAAALDVVLTADIESCLAELSSAHMLLQGRKSALFQAIENIHDKRISALERAQRGDEFEDFATSSSEEEDSDEEDNSDHEDMEDYDESEEDEDLDDDSDEEQEEEAEEDREDAASDEGSDSEEAEEDANAGDGNETDGTPQHGLAGDTRTSASGGGHLRVSTQQETAGASSLINMHQHMQAFDRAPLAKPVERRKHATHGLLSERQLRKVPWRLYQLGCTSCVQQLLRWREIVDLLEKERAEGSSCSVMSSYHWTTMLRHYVQVHQPNGGREQLHAMNASRSVYTLGLAGIELTYGWQYLGNIGPSGRLYWDPQTDRGKLAVAHAFSTRRGVLSTSSSAELRGEAASSLTRTMGIIEEKVYVSWQSSHTTVWKHVNGASLAGTWLKIVIDPTAHVQVLAVLAQELHRWLHQLRSNIGGESPAGGQRSVSKAQSNRAGMGLTIQNTAWVNLECQQAQLRDQRLPLLLLQAFRPRSMPSPNLELICELWLLSSGMGPQHCKAVAAAAAFTWRFCEASGLLDWAGHRHALTAQARLGAGASSGSFSSTDRVAMSTASSMWQLKVVCELSVRISTESKKVRRFSSRRISSAVASDRRESRRFSSAGYSDRRFSSAGYSDHTDKRKSVMVPGTISESEPPPSSGSSSTTTPGESSSSGRRTNIDAGAGLLPGFAKLPGLGGGMMPGAQQPEHKEESKGPAWARAALAKAFQVCFFADQSDKAEGLSDLCRLMNISEDDLLGTETGIQGMMLESRADLALEEIGLQVNENQTRAVIQMYCCMNMTQDTDSSVGLLPTHAVLVMGASAVGKSACIDGLVKFCQNDHSVEPWELLRLNSTSLTINASDSLLRPVEGSARISPDASASGLLERESSSSQRHPRSPSKAALAVKSHQVLVHVDGEIGPSMQSAFLSALSSVPCSENSARRPLQLSAQSWLTLPHFGTESRLGVAFEMGSEGARSLGPDMLTRCGMVYLGELEDFGTEVEGLVKGWVHQIRSQFDDSAAASTVEYLCENILIPLLLLLYGDERDYDGFLSGPSKKIKQMVQGSGGGDRLQGRRMTVVRARVRQTNLKQLQKFWGLPQMPRRVALLRVRDAFMTLFGQWSRKAAQEQMEEVERRGISKERRSSLETDTTSPRTSPRRASGSKASNSERRHSSKEKAGRKGSKDSPRKGSKDSPRKGSKESPTTSPKDKESPTSSRRNSRRSSAGGKDGTMGLQSLRRASGSRNAAQAKKVRKGTISFQEDVEVDVLQTVGKTEKEEPMEYRSEAVYAFFFATTHALGSLLTEAGLPVLEDSLSRLLDSLGGNMPMRLPVEYSIFDAVPDEQLKHFHHMDTILKPPDSADIDAFVFVQTRQSRRMLSLAHTLMPTQMHLALLGPPGSGKSSLLSMLISQIPMRDQPAILPAGYHKHYSAVAPKAGYSHRAELLYMSATQWLQPGRWERLLQRPLTRASKHSLRPRLFSWCLFVIDDCHCAPLSLREAWRFAMERGLVHSPGACAALPSQQFARSRAAAAQAGGGSAAGGVGGGSPNRRAHDRVEREAPSPCLQKLEGVMLILSARKTTDLMEQHSLIRHPWLFALEPLTEADILKIIGDNMSHFCYVKDVPAEVSAQKMLYVRLLHGLQLKLQETQASTRLITPHVIFRFFKSLLCLQTEWLCELKPIEFHKLMLHELIRETVDRLPSPARRAAALQEIAALQLSIFGGYDRDEEFLTIPKQTESREGDTGRTLTQIEEEGSDEEREDENHEDDEHEKEHKLTVLTQKLQALRFSRLGAAAGLRSGFTDPAAPQPYVDVSSSFSELSESIRTDMTRGWHRSADASKTYSPLLFGLSQLGSSRDIEKSLKTLLTVNAHDYGPQLRGCAGLEPRHALLGVEYMEYLLSLVRVMDLSGSKSRCQVWGRSGGKTLLLSPSVPVGLCLLRGAAWLLDAGFDTPFGLPGSEGAEGPDTDKDVPGLGAFGQGNLPSLGVTPSALSDGPSSLVEPFAPEELRAWLKDKFYHAVNDCANVLLCLPPVVLEREELLAVVHEAFAQAGPPDGWYSEREVKDCESVVSSLQADQRLLPPAAFQEEDGTLILTPLNQFWSEALGRVHIVLLGSTRVPEGRMSSRERVDAEMLDHRCPGLLQQLAVLHMMPLEKSAYVGAAKIFLQSPLLTPEQWQPKTPLRVKVRSDALAEAVAYLVAATQYCGDHSTAGMAPARTRPPHDLSTSPGPSSGACETAVRRLAPASTIWSGEGVDTGLRALPVTPIGDIGDILAATESLCRIKGKELQERWASTKDAHGLLEAINASLVQTSDEELARKLAETEEKYEEVQRQVEEKATEYNDFKDKLDNLVEEVITRCSHVTMKYKAAETMVANMTRQLGESRKELVYFTKQDQADLKKVVQQHCPPANEGTKELTPVLALFEICCMVLKVSPNPTRDDMHKTLTDPLFATKMAAVDIDNLPREYLSNEEVFKAIDGPEEFSDTKVLFMIANVVLSVFKVASTNAKLPEMKEEMDFLTKQRDDRAAEIEGMQEEEYRIADEFANAQAKEEEALQELERVQDSAMNTAERRNRIEQLCAATRHDKVRWDWALQKASQELASLIGDCLLSAVSCRYLGPLGQEHRQKLMAHWKAILERFGIKHSEDFDLASYWTPASARYRWHTELGLPKDKHLQEGVVLASLQSHTWPLFYDPDGIAGPFLDKLYPGAVRVSMGSADFHKDLLSAVQLHPGGGAGKDKESPLGQVVIIENTYLPALRESDLIGELLCRRQLRAAGVFSEGSPVHVTVPSGDDVVLVDPKLVLIFLSKLGEPLSRYLLSSELCVVDFRFCSTSGTEGVILEEISDSVLSKAAPAAHQELKQLQPERAQLIDDWRRLDEDIMQKVAGHLRSGESQDGSYPSEDHVHEVKALKADMDSVGRRLMKSRDTEAKLLQQRHAHEPLIVALCSLATAVGELFWMCPSSNLSLSGFLRLVEENLPPLSSNQDSGRGGKPPKSSKTDDVEWAVTARRAVLSAVWQHCQSGLPEPLVLPFALRLALSSAIPHRSLQDILAKMLLQCPVADAAASNIELHPAMCQTLDAILKGTTLSRALKQFAPHEERDSPPPPIAASPNHSSRPSVAPPRKSVSGNFRESFAVPTHSNSSMNNEGDPLAPSPSQRLLSKSVKAVGAVSALAGSINERDDNLEAEAMLESEESFRSVSKMAKRLSAHAPSKDPPSRGSSRQGSIAAGSSMLHPNPGGDTSPFQAGENKGIASQELLERLFVSDTQWEMCPPKQTFLARFCYFQEVTRTIVERLLDTTEHFEEDTEGHGRNRDANSVTQDLFRFSRILKPFETNSEKGSLEHLDNLLIAASMGAGGEQGGGVPRRRSFDAGSDQAARASVFGGPAVSPPSPSSRGPRASTMRINTDSEKAGGPARPRLLTGVSEAPGEDLAESGADTLAVISMVAQFMATGGTRAASCAVDVEWNVLSNFSDRLEDSVGQDSERWARWADFVASGGLRKEPDFSGIFAKSRGGFTHNFGPSPIEHLPLLASLPRELLGAVLPQISSGFPALTLRLLNSLAAFQVMLLTVLVCHSADALLAGAEALVAGIVGDEAPNRGLYRLEKLLSSSQSSQPVLCFCETPASALHESIFQLAGRQEGGRKVIQISMAGVTATPWAAPGKAGSRAGQAGSNWAVAGPAAASATTPHQILELVEECKDVGYWLVLHLHTGGTPSLGIDDGMGASQQEWDCYELLEWIWYNCSTDSFANTVSDRFRLFLLIDARLAQVLPLWFFDGRSVCLFDGQTGVQLRPWMQEAISSLHKRECPPNSAAAVAAQSAGAIPAPAPPPPATVGVAVTMSPLQLEMRLQPIWRSPVLNTSLAHFEQQVKLPAVALRLALQLLFATIAGCSRTRRVSPAVLVHSAEIGPTDAEVADEITQWILTHRNEGHPDAMAGLRWVDVLDAVATLVCRRGCEQGHASDAGFVYSGATPFLYNLLRHIRTFHLSRVRPEALLEQDAAESAEGRLGGKKKTKKLNEIILDETPPEFAWFNQDEPLTNAWANAFLQIVEGLEGLVAAKGGSDEPLLQWDQGPGSEDEAKVREGLQVLPLVEPHANFKQPGASPAVFLLTLVFGTPERRQLALPPLPEVSLIDLEPEEESTKEEQEEGILPPNDSILSALGKVDENEEAKQEREGNEEETSKQEEAPAVFSEAEDDDEGELEAADGSRPKHAPPAITVNLKTPSSSEENFEDSASSGSGDSGSKKGDKHAPLVCSSSNSVWIEGLVTIFEVTVNCIKASLLDVSQGFKPDDARCFCRDRNEQETPLQAEWRRQRHGFAQWVLSVRREAEAILQGLQGGLDNLCPRIWLKLRHLLHFAQCRALHLQATEVSCQRPRGFSSCPSEVWDVIDSLAARELPVPEGWQLQGFKEQGTFGRWLALVACQLHEVYGDIDVPRNLNVSKLAQLTPLLNALRLELAGRLRIPVEHTCLIFEPTQLASSSMEAALARAAGDDDDSPRMQFDRSPTKESTASSWAGIDLVDEVWATWDELNYSRPPCFKPASRLATPTHAAATLDAETPEVERTDFRRQSMHRKSLKSKVQGLAPFLRAASKVSGRKASQADNRLFARRPKDAKTLQKEFGTDELILTNLMADGAVWSTTGGLYIDSSVPALARLPPLRVRAATPRAAELLIHQTYPQSNGCMNLPLHRLLGSPWPCVDECSGGLAAESLELCSVMLPFTWSKPNNRWHPVMLLDGPPEEPPEGHMGRWPPGEQSGGASNTALPMDLEDRLKAPLPVVRPFGLHPSVLPVLGGPAPFSRANVPERASE